MIRITNLIVVVVAVLFAVVIINKQAHVNVQWSWLI